MQIMADFPRARVLVIGDIMIDHFIWGKVARISPEAPVPVVDVHADDLMLGGCANVLNNIFSMGGKPYVTGVVGADAMGGKVREEFKKRRISTQGLIEERDRPTSLKTRIVAHHQQVVRFDRESRAPIRKESVDRILTYLRAIRNGLGAIVISDYGKGVVTPALLDGVREEIAGRAIVVCVDPKQKDFSPYRGFDILTPNHHEAARAMGMENGNGADLVAVGKQIIERYQLKALLITRGEEGMSLFEKRDRTVHTHLPTEAREVFDVTGAGDTVIGVLALCMASGATFREAAVLANHAAGIVVGKVGTATVSREELKKVL